MRGEFDVAVFQAMKAVEVAVRAASNISQLGVKLMRSAFNPETGPLTDMTVRSGERTARMELSPGLSAPTKTLILTETYRSIIQVKRWRLSCSPIICCGSWKAGVRRDHHDRIVLSSSSQPAGCEIGRSMVPALIAAEGERASMRYIEFFTVTIRNPHTRAAYARATAAFLAWCKGLALPSP